MITLGSLGFAAPWILTALAALPVIWLLLRVMPPAPRRLAFPAIRLLFGLKQREETAARTPWWLVVLRLGLAILLIVGLARPLLDPAAALPGNGPLLLVIDDGWASAGRWSERLQNAGALIDRAERGGRSVALLTTAPPAGGEPAQLVGPLAPADARERVLALQPHPWPVDRKGTLAAIDRARADGPMNVVYLHDGLADPATDPLLERLQRIGPVQLMAPAAQDLPMLALPPDNRPGDIDVPVKRAPTPEPALALVRAVAGDGRLLAREPARFAPGAEAATARVRLPVELRNQIVRFDLEGQAQAGGVVLVDERYQRRPVGVVAPASADPSESLLDDRYYLERALGPFAEVRRGEVADLMKAPLAVLLVPDSITLSGDDREMLRKFMNGGGMVVRFAGNHIADAAEGDTLVPVNLRPGGRALGTAMQWSEPAHLAPFDANSPFAGLTVPDDVTVSRQILAEPTLDLPEKTWAHLADGTPLVTGAKLGQGWLVLFHVPANGDWSSLPLSGLFVDMLRRLVSLSHGVGSVGTAMPLPPVATLDGFGRLGSPPASAAALPAQAAGAAAPRVGPRQPPGFYGSDLQRRALNLGGSVTTIEALGPLPAGVERGALGTAGEVDLMPWLLTAALVIALADLVISLGLRGLLGARLAGGVAAALTGLLLLAGPGRAHAADDPAAFALKATLETRLAYVVTGHAEVDDISRAGLRGLTLILNRRTAAEAADPIAVHVETDELSFFPLLYWPVADGQAALSAGAVAKVNTYLRTGGTILFDTRDEGASFGDPSGSAGTRRLQQLVHGLDIPPVGPTPPDHVLTKSFYLMQEFPGRYAGGTLWVENRENATDEVSSVIIGSNDYAGAWAIDDADRPMYPVTPGGEQQREWAYRFGVNLVMYALTGNYKSDQVHVPSILERLGQ